MTNQDNLTKAWFFASRVHKEQKYPGEKLPYLTHLGNVMMEVMAVNSRLEKPELAITCAILHDSIEDTSVTYEVLAQTFSREVANGVLALTKDETLATKREQMLDSLERIKQQPQEIWVVKMADRVANLGEPPVYWKAEKVKAYRDEARIILDYLAEADEVMAERLEGKIGDYEKYLL